MLNRLDLIVTKLNLLYIYLFNFIFNYSNNFAVLSLPYTLNLIVFTVIIFTMTFTFIIIFISIKHNAFMMEISKYNLLKELLQNTSLFRLVSLTVNHKLCHTVYIIFSF